MPKLKIEKADGLFIVEYRRSTGKYRRVMNLDQLAEHLVQWVPELPDAIKAAEEAKQALRARIMGTKNSATGS